MTALELGRHAIGIELSPKYAKIAKKRLMGAKQILPGLHDGEEEGNHNGGEGGLSAERRLQIEMFFDERGV